MRILDKFYDYTIDRNQGFKLAFGDVVVSVVSHIPCDSYEQTMKGNGIAGLNIDFKTEPKDLIAFTFGSNNVELRIFNQKTDEILTKKYCAELNGYDDYEEILYGFTPFELVDILVKVKADAQSMQYKHKSKEELVMSKNKYTWKDIVKVNGIISAEEFEISGVMEDQNIYQIDDFLDAVARKYGVNVDDVETYMLDNIEFNPKELPYGAEECGCYINGVAEWLL